jgi:hypothetical protein
MTKSTATPRTWAILDTRPQFTGDSRCTVLSVYDHLMDAEAQWKWLSRGVGSHITPDCQRYVILELPLGVPVDAPSDED